MGVCGAIDDFVFPPAGPGLIPKVPACWPPRRRASSPPLSGTGGRWRRALTRIIRIPARKPTPGGSPSP